MSDLERKSGFHLTAGGYASLSCWYALVGPLGAAHFHFDARLMKHTNLTQFEPHHHCVHMGGVESHFATPPDYMKDDRPSHEKCWLIDRPCWHDGTSLWASEVWIPAMLVHGEEWIWRQLAEVYEGLKRDQS